jgi:4-alpha-glucanotransferase
VGAELPERLAAWGIEPGHHAIGGEWVSTREETAQALLAAMGARGPVPEPAAVLVHEAGRPYPLPEAHEVETEQGELVPAPRALPRRLTPGYHRLRRLRDGAETSLIVAPPTCYLPAGFRGWAWAAQLYALRSARSWGIGDLGDLRQLSGWARRQGARTVLVNPLHAALPLHPQEPSPYYPSSRVYRNPIYLRIEEVAGADRLSDGLERLARAGRELNSSSRIDRDRIVDLKLRALEAIFRGFQGDPHFDAYLQAEGRPLEDYATFCALTELHGRPWQDWPAELRDPRSPAVARVRSRYRRRVRFHQWIQWQLDRQLEAAAAELPPLHDLAVGVDPQGADAWTWRDSLADEITVGAPPDPFAPGGQDWAVRAFDPWHLRAAGYEPFIRTVRAALRHGRGLRVDHVMGLFRLFWIPPGSGPAGGAYVRYPYQDLLGILALESRRARAIVVGEDLGTVEPAVREHLARRRVLSYRLLWFEERPPADYPVDALAALTTHDLPTLAGILRGGDPDPGIRERLARFAGVSDGMPLDEAAEAAYAALAASPSRLVAATLEDALGVEERPNRPGTIDERNWSIPLPITLEELLADPRPARLATRLQRP